MADTPQSKAYIKGSEDLEADLLHWDLPDVSQPELDTGTNAFGRQANQAYQPKEEVPPILPPTLAEIEDIRAQAELEGLEEGKKSGFSEGLEKGRLEGLEQGHNQGFEQGQAQGLEQGLAQASDMITKFEGLLEQFKMPMAILDTEVEQELLTIVSALSKSLIGHELKTHPEHILSAIRIGVDALPLKEQNIIIRLHPDDAALVEGLYSQAQLDRKHWQIDADPVLVRGDCVIDSHKSQVDMRLETRLEQVFDQLDKQQDHLSQQKFQQEQQLEKQKLELKQQVELSADASLAKTDDVAFEAELSNQANEAGKQVEAQTSPSDQIGEQDADSSTSASE